ncbi:RNA polymerase sigma factor [Chitinophaga sp. 22321]|uniref:RNA polymerase sigma factor n=1 Tax=Chitinophaga sp. 22321 TaxID=3453909 RepID=UPI003F87CE3A
MQDLLEKIYREDDQLAFRQLFLQYSDRLIAFAVSLLPSREEAVADVFVKIWQNRASLSAVRNLNTYLYTAVRNTAYNYRISAGRIPEILTGEHIQVTVDTMAASPEDMLISKENLQKIEQAINLLPARCKLIFRLVKEDGLKYREVAEILEVSINTVNTQMAIALKKLAGMIDIHRHFGWPE